MLKSARPKTPQEALSRFFGYPAFRSGQEEVIRSVLQGNDNLVVMPTGGGKSICYQIPALLLEGVTIVISPLIALMKDQVDALRRRGINATTINSTLGFGEVQQRLTDVRFGKHALLYVAPERFENRNFLEALQTIQVSLLAIDEAHCISEWGHDFRPSYLRLKEAMEATGNPPVIALTATATPYVQEDILKQLGLPAAQRFVRGFDRPNLSYNVVESVDKAEDVREIMRKETERDGVSIIYCGTRKRVEEIGMMVHAERIPVTIYHAGLDDVARKTAQEAFISGRVKAIVATNAFGMGIDKPDVRHVIHVDMPGSLEGYYQEAGRAGRDGKPSDCTLLYSPRDRRLQEFFIRNSCPERTEVEAVYNALWDSVQVGFGSRYEGVFVPDEGKIADRAGIHPAALSGIITVLEKNELLRRVRAERLGAVRFTVSSSEIQRYYQTTRDEGRRSALIAVLRTVGGAALGQDTVFDPAAVSKKNGLTSAEFERGMRALMMGGVLEYTPPTPGTGYQFLQERLRAENIRLDGKALETSRKRSLLKLDAMERYVQYEGDRRNFILEYFGAESERVGEEKGAYQSSLSPGISKYVSAHEKYAMHQLLAVAAELGGRFGKMTLVDVLRGETTKTIRSFGLERYPRYGDLKQMERGELGKIAVQLIKSGLLKQSATLKPLVRITPAGRSEIRTMTLTMFVRQEAELERANNPELLRLLREERERIAHRDRVAPETLCTDFQLVRIANALPDTRHAFLRIDGLTDEIFNRCGTSMISVIEEYLSDSNDGDVLTKLPHRLHETWGLITEGYGLEEIATKTARQASTISSHIEELIRHGISLSIEQFVPAGILRAVGNQLEQTPRATLRELRALLGNSVDFPTLRIAVAWLKAQHHIASGLSSTS